MNSRLRQDMILRHLRRTGTSTINIIAAETGVSRRTILRDIGALREEGYAFDTEPGRGGGIQLDARSLQRTAGLSVAEVFALIISVASMKIEGKLPFATLADSGLAKIEKTLSADKLRDLRRLLEGLHIGQLSPLQDLSDMGPMVPDLIPTIETAFLEKLFLAFDYQDAQGRTSRRVVESQAILILPPLWYLVAWDPAKQDCRHFRMDRISNPVCDPTRTFRPRHVPFDKDVCPFRGVMI